MATAKKRAQNARRSGHVTGRVRVGPLITGACFADACRGAELPRSSCDGPIRYRTTTMSVAERQYGRTPNLPSGHFVAGYLRTTTPLWTAEIRSEHQTLGSLISSIKDFFIIEKIYKLTSDIVLSKYNASLFFIRANLIIL